MAKPDTGPFKTAAEAETARKLGFKFPAKKGGEQKLPPTTTTVVGYFNPHPYPIHIQISVLGGLSVVLQQKGDYVLTSDGKKVNDPILEQYVQPHGLAREVSKVQVPINYIPRQLVDKGPAGPSVMEAQGFKRGPNGQVVPILKPAATIINNASVQFPDAGSNPVVGMTREMAEKLGLIRKTYTPRESTVVDTDGVPARGEQIPEMEYAVDMTPGMAKRIAATNPTPPVAQPPPPLNPEMTQPENEEQAKLLEDLEASKSAQNPFLMGGDPSKLAPKIADAPPPVVEETVTESQEEVAEEPTSGVVYGGQPASTTPPTPKPKFVCSEDGKVFQFRSGLERHARLKWPAKYDEIMAPYPK